MGEGILAVKTGIADAVHGTGGRAMDLSFCLRKGGGSGIAIARSNLALIAIDAELEINIGIPHNLDSPSVSEAMG
jgi:hypothetical protein